MPSLKPVYYERYMSDDNNLPVADRQDTQDRIHWFFSMDYAGRRQYSQKMATNVLFDNVSWCWPNLAKPFFNKCVAANTTDVCQNYPPNDMSVWDW